MNSSYTESALRDSIAENISLLEQGLIFLGREAYLPDTLCTRSFLDLLGKDKDGKLVLIEVKKSGRASREALHEVLKYIEAAKNHFGMRESELRVLIASAEWRELIIPFSSFVGRTECDVKGLRLEVGSEGSLLFAEAVEPIIIRSERVFSPYYEILFCDSRKKQKRKLN